MKKYIFLVISLLYFNTTLSCPCEFSPEDQRPFFEQYEEKLPTQQEKEEEQ